MNEDTQLPSAMQMEAQGNTDPMVRQMARNERRAMRVQSFDDQVFAALLERIGGDEATARVYWNLSRQVRAYLAVRPTKTTVQDILDMFEDEDLDELAEQLFGT